MGASVMVGSGHSGVRRRTPAWRLLVVLAVASLVVVGLPVLADAGPPVSSTTSGAAFICESDTEFLFVDVFEDSEFGEVFMEAIYESSEGEPFGLFGFTEGASWDGTSLYAEVEMFLEHFENGEENGNGEPESVGVALIDAAFEPIDEPEIYMDRFREGNIWIEIRDTVTEAAVTGSAALEGFFDFDLSECGGYLYETVVWQTNPNAFNNRLSEHVVECALEGPDGEGFLTAESLDFGQFMDVFIAPLEGPGVFGFTEDFVFTHTEVSGVVELEEEDTGEPVGEAMVGLVLEFSNLASSDFVLQNGRVKIIEELFDVSGTVVVDGSEFEAVDCFSVAYDIREHFSNPSGPKPEGKTPANETPEGAVSLEARGTTNAQTKGAANAPEQACTFTFEPENGENGEEPEEFPLPIGKTLWYTFEGTGGDVTIDSAGSNFDTILGVYDSEMNQIACVDDVGDESGFSLQAAATIQTTDSHIYYVQVGGFGFWEEDGEVLVGEFGRIRLNMN